jgi:hypothetical protein
MGGQAVPDFAARSPSRVVIEDVTPKVDGGRFAAKRTVGEPVEVGATIFAEGHDLLSAWIDNGALIAYGKTTPDLANVLIVFVNLDPHHPQSGFLELPLRELGIDPDQPYQVDDLLGGARYLWQGPRNYIALAPQALPAHVFRVRRRIRIEQDFDYFL